MRSTSYRLAVYTAVLASVLASATAFAQPGPGGGRLPQLSDEDRAKAWELQAKSVAKSLALNDEQTAKLVETYQATRKTFDASLRERMSQGGGGGGPNWQEAVEFAQGERTKLETALKGFLNEEQAGKAMASLGGLTGGGRWDRMVLAIDQLGLDDAKKSEALAAVSNYIAESNKMMQDAAGGGNLDDMRTKGQELRGKLDAELEKIITAEQLAKWKELTPMRRGGGAGLGGGRRQEGDAAAGAPPAGAPPAPAAPDAPQIGGAKKKEE